MEFGESEGIREKGKIRLLKFGARHDREVYCVIGKETTKHFDDYEDALEEFTTMVENKKHKVKNMR